MVDNSYKQDLHLSWDDIYSDTQKLAADLEQKGPWEGIVCITRGGLVPAALLSRMLDITMVETMCMYSYDYQDQGRMVVLKKPQAVPHHGAGWLVVDDLTDTGKTFAEVRRTLKMAHFACLYVKPAGAEQTDSHVRRVTQQTWIHFPWEIEGQ